MSVENQNQNADKKSIENINKKTMNKRMKQSGRKQ
jgi:hypothetical protein